MVGIHERSAREKIYANSVAHIMNDETTRKYLQSVKRLMTFCQRKYPTDLSRSVEFNSLANGSDPQSLLAEQNAKNSEETLRLVGCDMTQSYPFVLRILGMSPILECSSVASIGKLPIAFILLFLLSYRLLGSFSNWQRKASSAQL